MSNKNPPFQLSLEEDRRIAMLSCDATELKKLLADSIVYIHSTGAFDSQGSYIEKLTSGALKYLELSFSDMKTHVFVGGNVVTGRMSALVLKDGKEKAVSSSFMTVWGYEREKGWRMFAHQGTPIS